MTRDEFEKAIDKISLDYPFRHIINYLKDHDAEQRRVIEQLNGIISRWEDTYAGQKELLEQQAQQIATLREALQLLYDVQNGCPLPKYQADWDKAMEMTDRLLKEHS